MRAAAAKLRALAYAVRHGISVDEAETWLGLSDQARAHWTAEWDRLNAGRVDHDAHVAAWLDHECPF